MKRKSRGEHRASEGRESAPARRPGTPQASSLNRIHGVNPVLEALRSGRRSIEHIAIAEGARDERFRELLELAGSSNVPVRRVSPRSLTAMAETSPIKASAGKSPLYSMPRRCWTSWLPRLQPSTNAGAMSDDWRTCGTSAVLRTVECGCASSLYHRTSCGRVD